MERQQTTFQYPPLGSDEIRLVCFRRAWIPKRISLEVHQFPREHCPPYIAISYTWGDENEDEPILLNGHEFRVRKNLFAFLQRAKRYKWPGCKTFGFFWVDALCIDQGNLDERNTQVSKMTTIYEMARQVVAWLGSNAKGAEIVADIVSTLANNFITPDAVEQGFVERLLAQDQNRNALSSFLTNPYWKRAWIVQEITTPHDNTAIWYGRSRLLWGDVSLAAINLVNRVKDSPPLLTRFRNDLGSILGHSILNFDRMNLNKNGRLDVLEVLDATSFSSATDPRDLLYSTITLSVEAEHSDLRPQYQLPVEEVYKSFAHYMIAHHGNLDILGYCYASIGDIKVPSWVPDWTQRVGICVIEKQTMMQGKKIPLYKASQGKSADAAFSDNGMLSLSGTVFDEIIALSAPFKYDTTEQASIDLAREWTRFVSAMTDTGSYICGGTTMKAMRHVVCVDRDVNWKAECTRGHAAQWPEYNARNGTLITGPRDPFEMQSVVKNGAWGRSLFVTQRGFLGMVSMNAQAGDKVCVLYGGSLPIVLRKINDYWIVIGECYVHGIMDGEALGYEHVQIQEFHIR